MKVLIAGATGLIGKELVRQCEEASIEVHYLTTRKNMVQRSGNVIGFYWNPSKGEIDEKAFDGVSAVINLAGASVSKRWTKTYKTQILESRILSARLIKTTLQRIQHEVTHYISSSGISIYPSSKHKLYAEEDTVQSETFLGKVVADWETAADELSDLGIKVSKVRTGIVLQSDEGALAKLVAPIKSGVGAALGSGQQWQSWIHVRDIAGIYMFLLMHSLEGVYNGVAPSPVTNSKMTRAIAQRLKKPLWLPKVPGWFLKVLFGEMSEIVLESQLVSAKKLEEAGYDFHFVNLEKALEDLL
ncbi:MAG: TIGR01777 family oxidoreductase [Bacteroidota bacterium]